jgi:hypothetical protein
MNTKPSKKPGKAGKKLIKKHAPLKRKTFMVLHATSLLHADSDSLCSVA